MKNKLIIMILLILLDLSLSKLVTAKEFLFEVSSLEIIDNGNIYKGNNRGKIIANTQLELLSDNFEYSKKSNVLFSYWLMRLKNRRRLNSGQF